jgi:hypothetical protein
MIRGLLRFATTRYMVHYFIRFAMALYVNSCKTRFVLLYPRVTAHLYTLYYLICTVVHSGATLASRNCSKQFLTVFIGVVCILALDRIYVSVLFARQTNTQRRSQPGFCSRLKTLPNRFSM